MRVEQLELGRRGAGADPAAKTAAPGSSNSENAIKIGVLATCGGSFALFENEAFSGAKYALVKEAGGKSLGTGPQAGVSGATIAGRPVSLYFGCSDATPDVAVSEARAPTGREREGEHPGRPAVR